MQDALVIATPTLLTACALRGWLGAGHRVAELWCCEPQSGFLRPPRSLAGRLFPDFDAAHVLAEIRVHGLAEGDLAGAADTAEGFTLVLNDLKLLLETGRSPGLVAAKAKRISGS